MDLNTSIIPAAIGAAFGGGFYAGSINIDGAAYVLILSPAAGALKGAWNSSRASVPGTEHYADGLANTQAMAAAGSELAAAALALDIGGVKDWYIPSRDELELLYRHFKPTREENAESFRDGDNPSSVPVGYPYTGAMPAQTNVATFQSGGDNAIEAVWHWSSTQYAPLPDFAWGQDFDNGGQYGNFKSYAGRARAVRRLKI